jgi:histone H3/H4
MSSLLNHTAARKLAKSLNIRLGSTGADALEAKISDVIIEAAERARLDNRKTILERDVLRGRDLFS